MAFEAVNALASAANSHSTSIGNVAIIGAVVAGEQFVLQNMFGCPCYEEDDGVLLNPRLDHSVPQGRVLYAYSFLIFPAAAFMCMALAINGEVKRCLTSSTKKCHIRHHIRGCKYMAIHAVSCLVPPLAWFLVLLLDGRYLACSMTLYPDACFPLPLDLLLGGDEEVVRTLIESKMPLLGNDTEVDFFANFQYLQQLNTQHKSFSQFLGWVIIGSGSVLGAIGIIFGQLCTGGMTYFQRRFTDKVRQKEMETFESVSDELLTDELQKKWRSFFMTAQKGDWDNISDLPMGDPRVVKGHYYYTPFHQWETRNTDDPIPDTPSEKVAGSINLPLPDGTYPQSVTVLPIMYSGTPPPGYNGATSSMIPLGPVYTPESKESKKISKREEKSYSKSRGGRLSSLERKQNRRDHSDEEDDSGPERMNYKGSHANKGYVDSEEELRMFKKSRNMRNFDYYERSPSISKKSKKSNRIHISDEDDRRPPSRTLSRFSSEA